MDENQKTHIEFVTLTFRDIALKKYTKGVKEHGGNLWEKKNLIDFAIDEAIDQVIYLITLKYQIEDSGVQLGKVEDKK